MKAQLGIPCAALVLCMTVGIASAQVNYVVEISVDGLGSSYLDNLLTANQVPNFNKIKTEGVFTLNARDDYDYTETLQNHVTMVTGRGVYNGSNDASTTTGHYWYINGETGQTIQQNRAGRYVASVFDVAHDNGLRTGLFATKAKFNLIDFSYNGANGALDVTGVDNTRDKIDTAVIADNSSSMMSSYIAQMKSNPFNYSFVHIADPDLAGHGSTWGSASYNNAVKTVDGYIGQIFTTIDDSALLKDHTVIIVTADHGGTGNGHSDATLALDYTIPFMVWGPGVTHGDLYAMNSGVRLDPGAGRPLYSAAIQPVRNGDGANLALDLLGLGAIPGSTLNATQNMVVSESATMSLLGLGVLALAAAGLGWLLVRRSRKSAHSD